MDWKQEAVDMLRGYGLHKQALEDIPRELERLEAACAGIRSARPDRMPRPGNSSSGREDAMLSNIIRRDELKRRLKEARLWVETVSAGLSVLDEEERLALEYCYIHKLKGSIDLLCERLCLEKSAAYRRRDQALCAFTRALYGPLPGL